MINEPIYELCDTSDDEMYYSIGMFQTIDDIKNEIAKHDESGDRVSEYAEEKEELAVIEHKFGWIRTRKVVLKIRRDEYYDEVTDEYLWKTTNPEQK